MAARSGSQESGGEGHAYAKAILRTTRQPLLVLRGDLTVETANPAFYRTFEVEPTQTEGHKLYGLGNGQWNIPELRRLLEEMLPDGGEVTDFKVSHDFAALGRRVMLLNAHRMRGEGADERILLAIDDITASEQALWEVNAQREYVEKVVDATRDPLLILGLDLRVQAANATFYSHFGVDPAATEGRLVYELGNGQWDMPDLRDLLETILPANASFDDFEVEHEFEGIGRRIMVLNARRIDHLELILLAIEDRTMERRAQRALAESERRYRTLFESIDEGFCIFEMLFDAGGEPADYRFLEVNPAFVRHTGLVDAVGRRMRELAPAHEQHWFEVYGRIALTGEPARFEHPARHLGDRWFDVYAFRIGAPEARRVAAIFRDVADKKAAEDALRESEARLAALMRHAPIGVGLVDPRGDWLLANPALQQLTSGRMPSRDPMQAARWHPAVPLPPEAWPGARALRGEIVSPGMDFRRDLDGEQRWYRVSAAPVERPPGGPIENAVVIVEDITEQKRTEEQRELLLMELNHRLKNTFAVIRSLASRGAGAGSVAAYRNALLGRLDALFAAHALALESRWESVDLARLAAQTLRPFAEPRPEALEITGGALMLAPRAAFSLSLALHELATNAAKYGALATGTGRVVLGWREDHDEPAKIALWWNEFGGPPVSPPDHPGFGTRLVERVFTYELGGGATFHYRENGLKLEAWFRVE